MVAVRDSAPGVLPSLFTSLSTVQAVGPFSDFEVDGFEEFYGAFEVGNLVTDEGEAQHVGWAIRGLSEKRGRCRGEGKGEKENLRPS